MEEKKKYKNNSITKNKSINNINNDIYNGVNNFCSNSKKIKGKSLDILHPKYIELSDDFFEDKNIKVS